MFNKKHVLDYLGWFLNNIKQLQTDAYGNCLYKISRVFLENSEIIFTIQMTGKNVFFNLSLSNLIADPEILDNLSPKENRYISFLAVSEQHKPRYFIQNTMFSDSDKTTVYYVKQKNAEGLMAMSPSELLNFEAFPEQFSKEDILKVGFDLGAEL